MIVKFLNLVDIKLVPFKLATRIQRNVNEKYNVSELDLQRREFYEFGN